MKWLLIVLILVVLIVAILLPTKQKGKIKSFFKEARNDRNQNFNSFSDFDLSKMEQRFKELENQIKRLVQENKEIRDALKQNIDEIQGLMDRNSQEWYQSQRQIRAELNLLKDRLDKIDSSSQRHPSIKPNTVSQNKNVFYAMNFRDTLLKVVSREEAQYELERTSTNEALFTYCGDFETACSNRDAVFDGVCQLIGNIQLATKIRTIEKGTAALENGKWKVIKKAIIKFE